MQFIKSKETPMCRTIYVIMECPVCHSTNCYSFSTNEIEFDGGDSHYYADCCCVDCKKTFKLCMKFEYSATNSWIRV